MNAPPHDDHVTVFVKYFESRGDSKRCPLTPPGGAETAVWTPSPSRTYFSVQVVQLTSQCELVWPSGDTVAW